MAYESFARVMQQRLKAHGYDIGKAGVDGVAGKVTRGALRKFQEAMGLPVTGTATRQTMTALLKAPKAKADAVPPMPRMRPPPQMPMPRMRPAAEVLGTGNTNFMPRLRPTDQPQPDASAPSAPPPMLPSFAGAAAGPAMDFAGPQPPARPELQQALAQAAAQRGAAMAQPQDTKAMIWELLARALADTQLDPANDVPQFEQRDMYAEPTPPDTRFRPPTGMYR